MRVIELYELNQEPTPLALPLYTCSVRAGFPSPADNFIDLRLDLNQHLIRNPSATFFVRVSGDSMIGAGIHDGDILVVDRSLAPTDGRIVIAVVNGECCVKRIHYKKNYMLLVSENEKYAPLKVTEFETYDIWGVVTSVIHAL